MPIRTDPASRLHQTSAATARGTSVTTVEGWDKAIQLPGTRELQQRVERYIRNIFESDKDFGRVDAHAALTEVKVKLARSVSVVGYPLGGTRGLEQAYPLALRGFTAELTIRSGSRTVQEVQQGYARAGETPSFGYGVDVLTGSMPEATPTRADYEAHNGAARMSTEHRAMNEPAPHRIDYGSRRDALVDGMNVLVRAQLGGAAAKMNGMGAMMRAASNPFDPNFWNAWMGRDIHI